jgi:hypothetical protein
MKSSANDRLLNLKDREGLNLRGFEIKDFLILGIKAIIST